MVGPRGKAHGALGRCKRKFCRGQGPDTRDIGVWPWTPRTVASGAGIREGLFLAFQTDFGEALSPSYDPRVQHINRGAGLAPRTQVLETPLVDLVLVLVGPS